MIKRWVKKEEKYSPLCVDRWATHMSCRYCLGKGEAPAEPGAGPWEKFRFKQKVFALIPFGLARLPRFTNLKVDIIF